MNSKKICEWCKKEIKTIKHGNQKYHLEPQPGQERSCSEYARLTKKTEKYNPQYKKNRNTIKKDELGSKGTGLKKTLPSNPIKAHRLIKKEYKRLGLTRNNQKKNHKKLG